MLLSSLASTLDVHKLLDFAKVLLGVTLSGSFVSVIIYQVVHHAFLHPLAKYPGPFLAKFTNLYSAYHAWKGDIHTDILRCHERYGIWVRYAPNRVLINTADGLRDVYGHGAPVTKGHSYKVLSARAPNTLTMQDKLQHSRRRRVLSQAFSEISLRKFEPVMQARIDSLLRVVRGADLQAGQWSEQSNMAHRFTHLAFDTMTALTFDIDYRTIEEDEYRFVMDAVEKSNVRLAALWQMPNLTFWGLDRKLLPESDKAAKRFVLFLRSLMQIRLGEDKAENNDIFSFLQQCKDPDTDQHLTLKDLSTETATFVVAGVDTSSTTMASMAHYLSCTPKAYLKVVEEVRATFGSVKEIQLGKKLNSCMFLRACMDEALRLSPPGGGPPWRVIDNDKGMTINGQFVPSGCEVGCGIYAMQRSPANWEHPHQFMPERWTDEVEGRRPYFPFNIGPRSCVGKPLAIAQIMLTFARLLFELDFERVEEIAGSAANVETLGAQTIPYVLRDHVTGQKDGPMLRFCPRL
ncbi:hypothetical protein EsHS_00006522 [Epichloe bromicola]